MGGRVMVVYSAVIWGVIFAYFGGYYCEIEGRLLANRLVEAVWRQF